MTHKTFLSRGKKKKGVLKLEKTVSLIIYEGLSDEVR